MESKVKTQPDKTAYLVQNNGQFMMLYPKGNAFLYPGAQAVVTEPITDEDKAHWEKLGCKYSVITYDKALELLDSSSALGVKG